jgi:hypothetical protein
LFESGEARFQGPTRLRFLTQGFALVALARREQGDDEPGERAARAAGGGPHEKTEHDQDKRVHGIWRSRARERCR